MLQGLTAVQKAVTIGTLLIGLILPVAALIVAAIWIRGRFRSTRPSPSRKRTILGAAILGLALIELLCLLYAWQIEPYWLEVTDIPVELPQMTADSVPIRIVHLTDLHCDAKARLEPELPDLVRPLHPDLIVFTGDGINQREGLENFRTLMRDLTAIAPVYAVSGNWDYYFGLSPDDLYRGTEVHLLQNSAEKVEIHSFPLWLVGVDEAGPVEMAALLGRVPPGQASLVLSHRPDTAPDAAEFGADAYLCGHTHGGQVALPEYGALVTLSKYGKRFERGRVELKNTTVYINRGIGMEGGIFPRLRFCSRPEIALIRLVPQADREAGAKP